MPLVSFNREKFSCFTSCGHCTDEALYRNDTDIPICDKNHSNLVRGNARKKWDPRIYVTYILEYKSTIYGAIFLWVFVWFFEFFGFFLVFLVFCEFLFFGVFCFVLFLWGFLFYFCVFFSFFFFTINPSRKDYLCILRPLILSKKKLSVNTRIILEFIR